MFAHIVGGHWIEVGISTRGAARDTIRAISVAIAGGEHPIALVSICVIADPCIVVGDAGTPAPEAVEPVLTFRIENTTPVPTVVARHCEEGPVARSKGRVVEAEVITCTSLNDLEGLLRAVGIRRSCHHRGRSPDVSRGNISAAT